MKFILILTSLALYVAHTFAEEGCAGRPLRQNCFGGRDEGIGGPNCDWNARRMWQYDEGSDSCAVMQYKGCGGNSNRFCTPDECLKCQRCKGRPQLQNCFGGKDEGLSGPNCNWNANRMWYYDQGTNDCLTMQYKGCGGNSNRFCSRDECLHCMRSSLSA